MKGYVLKNHLTCMLIIVLGFALIMPSPAGAASPKRELWSCYDVGSSGYIQASSIADAMLKKYGMRVRLTPAGTAISRLIPLINKRVDFGFLASEVYCAVEGLYEFSTIEWGPQDLRVVLAAPASHAMAVSEVSGLKKIEDAIGKRWATFPSSSDKIKLLAYLAYLNVTEKDVEMIEFPGYSASTGALKDGNADLAGMPPTAGHAYEMEAHPKGLHFLEFDPNNAEGIARMQQVAPMMSIGYETVGAGLSKDKGVWLGVYRYPMLTVRADMDADTVYEIIKRMDETYPLYKDAYPPNKRWDINESGVPPVDAPFHEGAIRYLKEKGIWKPEHDVWNNKRIAHLKNVKVLWQEFLDSIDQMDEKAKNNLKGDKFSKAWLDYRKKGLEKLGE